MKEISRMSGLATTIYRVATMAYAKEVDLLSGHGSSLYGQRWNPPGIAAIYGAISSPELALKEALAKNRCGIGAEANFTPRVIVAIDVLVERAIDLTTAATLRLIGTTRAELLAEDWREMQREGKEPQTQAIARMFFQMGAEALIVPSARSARGKNLVVFPKNLLATSKLTIHDRDKLPTS